MMPVSTPGIGRSSARAPIVADGPMFAIVLDLVAPAIDEPRATSGTYVNVLLTETMQELPDVLLANAVGASSGDGWLPEWTDPDVLTAYRESQANNGKTFIQPLWASGWGSQVLVEFVRGVPFIRPGAFPPPSAPLATLPVVPQADTVRTSGARAVSVAQTRPDMVVNVPAPPYVVVPSVYSKQSAEYTQAFEGGWYAAYTPAYTTGRAPGSGVKGGDAEGDGFLAGFNRAAALALKDRAAANVEDPVAEEPDWTSPDTDGPSDQTAGIAIPARTVGSDRVIKHGEALIIIRNDGEIIIDVRNKGRAIRMQGQTIALTNGVIDIVLDGATGEVRLGGNAATSKVVLESLLETAWSDLVTKINAAISAATAAGPLAITNNTPVVSTLNAGAAKVKAL